MIIERTTIKTVIVQSGNVELSALTNADPAVTGTGNHWALNTWDSPTFWFLD